VSTPQIRAARPTQADAQAFARLYEAATFGMMRCYLGSNAYHRLANLFLKPRHEHSFDVTTLMDVDGQAAGLLMGYSAMAHEAMSRRTVLLYLRYGGWDLLRSLPTSRRLRPLRAVTGTLPPDAYYIKGLAVSPPYQRQGIGRQLMAFAEVQARDAGCTRMVLDVRTHNAAALALYHVCGYHITEKTPSVRVNAEEVAFVRMEKGL
jgi:ribosomal protein S18 acetylase RimI-like enzyme